MKIDNLPHFIEKNAIFSLTFKNSLKNIRSNMIFSLKYNFHFFSYKANFNEKNAIFYLTLENLLIHIRRKMIISSKYIFQILVLKKKFCYIVLKKKAFSLLVLRIRLKIKGGK